MPAHRSATLEDIARVAGVSRSTASRVLAGTGPASRSARDRVLAAAAQIGYAPDPVARALVRGAGVRLVVAVSGAGPTVVDDPYVDRAVAAVARVCAPHGVGVALRWLPLAAPGQLAQLAADRTVHGVLLINTTAEVIAAVPGQLRGRVVSIGIGSAAVPSFDIDNHGGATAILTHLYASGRRRIAMVAGPDWLPCARRPVVAYQALMAAAGLPIRLLPGDFTADSGRASADAMLARWPDTDAVFAICDATALGALSALRSRGVDVPGQIAVAGFDDIPFAPLSLPALTTATHPVDRIASAAATALLDGVQAAPETLFASELVLRQSA